MNKYEMKIDLNVLNHLGLNLYSNTVAVLSEVIANAWDADSTKVSIQCSQESEQIVIIDNGIGMDTDSINAKFLCVGYQRRNHGEATTAIFNRPVMGRKGIGKLSLLSIADSISIYSKKNGQTNAFRLSREDIETEIAQTKNSYSPQEIEFVDFEYQTGTKIVISNIKKNISRVPESLRKKLARRFSVIGDNFEISINNIDLSIEDRDYFKKIQFLWPLGGGGSQQYEKFSNILVQPVLSGEISDLGYTISGWLGTAVKPSDIEGNNKISIITRGKLSQEDVLKDFDEGGVYASYLIGEIHADFLDFNEQKDISTSNRQQFNEEDERYKALKKHLYALLKRIQSDWGKLRKREATKKILSGNPVIGEWYNSLKPATRKYAEKIFATIEGLHTDDDETDKKELLKYGILAFERLRVTEKLNFLDKIDEFDLARYGEIFGDIQDIESALYWDIANARVKVIRQLASICDDNSKEKIIQQHIFDNLWLLNPSWERAASASERLEQSVAKEFAAVSSGLNQSERAGRIDIRYKTTAGKHIIIELKRYVTTYKLDAYDLMKQTDKYIAALQKCLKAAGKENQMVEAICIIGQNVIPTEMTLDEFRNKVAQSCRVLTYDQLIDDSLQSYQSYLDKEKEIGKIKAIIEKL